MKDEVFILIKNLFMYMKNDTCDSIIQGLPDDLLIPISEVISLKCKRKESFG